MSSDLFRSRALDEAAAEGVTQEHHESHESNVSAPLCFLIIALVSGSFLHGLTHLIPIKYRPPSSVCLFVWGSILPWIGEGMTPRSDAAELLSDALQAATEVDPHLVFYALLPPLLYESAAGLHWHVFRRVASSSIILAIPGVMINVLFVTLFMIWVFGSPWQASTAMLSGAIVSATDPVAVVACLRSLHAPKKLSSLIEGESLINDGSAVVLFLIAENMVEEEHDGGEGLSFGGSFLLFLQLALGGPLFGIVVAALCEMWLKRVHDDKITEVSIVMSCFFATYFIGEEMLHVSGVLAVVFFGIYMGARGRFALDVGNEESLRAVVEQVAHFADQTIFVIAGSVSNKLLRRGFEKGYVNGWHLLNLLVLYVALHVFRMLVVLIFMPVLHRLGYGLQPKEAFFLVFAGIRGAVGLALVLLAQLNPKIDTEIQVLIGFYISGFTCLTLCVNGTLARVVYLKLNMYPESDMRAVVLRQVMQQMKAKALKEATEVFEKHWLLCHVDIDSVANIVPHFEEADVDTTSGCLTCPSTPPVLVFRDLLQVARMEQYKEEDATTPGPTPKHREESTGSVTRRESNLSNTMTRIVSVAAKLSVKSSPVSILRMEEQERRSELTPLERDSKAPAPERESKALERDSKALERDSKALQAPTVVDENGDEVRMQASATSVTSRLNVVKSRSVTSRGSMEQMRRFSVASTSVGGVSDVYQTLNSLGENSGYLSILLLQSTNVQYLDLYERKDLEAKPFNELCDAVSEGIDFANKESLTGTTTKHLVKRLRTMQVQQQAEAEAAERKAQLEDVDENGPSGPSVRSSERDSYVKQQTQDNETDDNMSHSASEARPDPVCRTLSSRSGCNADKRPPEERSSGRQLMSPPAANKATLARAGSALAFTLDPQIAHPPRRVQKGTTDSTETSPKDGHSRLSPDHDGRLSPTEKGDMMTLFVPGQVPSAFTHPSHTAPSFPAISGADGADEQPAPRVRVSYQENKRERSPSKTNHGLRKARSTQSLGGVSNSASVMNSYLKDLKDQIMHTRVETEEEQVMRDMSAWDIEWVRLHQYLSAKEPTRIQQWLSWLPKFGSDFMELKAKLQVIYAYVEAHQDVLDDARFLLVGAESLEIMESHILLAQDSIWGLCPDAVTLRLARMVLGATILLNIHEQSLKEMVRGGCLSERDAKEIFNSLERQRKGLHECYPHMLKVRLPAYALQEGKWNWLSLFKALWRRRENVRKRRAAEKHAEQMRKDAIIQGYCLKLNHSVNPQSSTIADWMQRFFVLLRETKVLNYISEKKGGELIPVGSVANLLAAWREEVPELGIHAIILEFPGKKHCVLGFQDPESESSHDHSPLHVHTHILNHHHHHPHCGIEEMQKWSEALSQLGVEIAPDCPRAASRFDLT